MDELRRRAQEAAKRYLEHSGFTIIATDEDRSLRGMHLVARDGDTLVAVLVKLNDPFGEGLPPKQVRYGLDQLEVYRVAHDQPATPLRYDLVNIRTRANDRATVQHTRGLAASPPAQPGD